MHQTALHIHLGILMQSPLQQRNSVVLRVRNFNGLLDHLCKKWVCWPKQFGFSWLVTVTLILNLLIVQQFLVGTQAVFVYQEQGDEFRYCCTIFRPSLIKLTELFLKVRYENAKIHTFYSSQLSFLWDPIYKSKIIFIKCTLRFFNSVSKVVKIVCTCQWNGLYALTSFFTYTVDI